MARNRVGTPKFYLDAVLLARQWGMIEAENSSGLFYLNPSDILSLGISHPYGFFSVSFKNRYFINSISHCFVLGHNFLEDEIAFSIKGENADSSVAEYLYYDEEKLDNNGWHKLEWLDGICTDKNLDVLVVRLAGESGTYPLGDISAGWSYTMEHSSDLELTLNFSNESISTQTTKGGHTLTSAAYNHQAGWIRPAWSRGGDASVTNENFKIFPSGRRSWNLKFSYLNDELSNDSGKVGLFPYASHDSYGIFAKIGTIADNLETPDVDESATLFSIKQDFMSKVYHGTNGFMLPFLFQPDQNVDEYAICRIDNDTASFNQVSNNVYDCSIDVVEVW